MTTRNILQYRCDLEGCNNTVEFLHRIQAPLPKRWIERCYYEDSEKFTPVFTLHFCTSYHAEDYEETQKPNHYVLMSERKKR